MFYKKTEKNKYYFKHKFDINMYFPIFWDINKTFLALGVFFTKGH